MCRSGRRVLGASAHLVRRPARRARSGAAPKQRPTDHCTYPTHQGRGHGVPPASRHRRYRQNSHRVQQHCDNSATSAKGGDARRACEAAVDPAGCDGAAPVHSATTTTAVPDILAPGLDIVFCGINPGRVSSAAGAHFANPRNDFWRLLHDSGLTRTQLSPTDQWELPRHGYGLTNAAYRTTKGSGDLHRADFAGADERLTALARDLQPRLIAFVGKEAYRGAFGRRPELGLQPEQLETTRLFVLPSTSPANAAVPYAQRLRWFRALAQLAGPG